MEHKGIILKIKPNTMIVLTKDVDFVEIKKKKSDVYEGMEISFLSSDVVKPRPNYTKYAVAAALIICLWVTSLFFTSAIFAKPCAYVSVDINPSFELGVNKHKTITEVQGLNAESIEMLQDMNLKNLNIDKGIQMIIERSFDKGYLKTDQQNYILIAVSGNQESQEEKDFLDELTSDIVKSSNTVLKQKKNQVEIEIIKTDINKKRIAESQKMSVGKYLLWEKTKSKNPNLSIDDFKKENLKTSIKRLEGLEHSGKIKNSTEIKDNAKGNLNSKPEEEKEKRKTTKNKKIKQKPEDKLKDKIEQNKHNKKNDEVLKRQIKK
ncbi:MAG: hypothetical protein PWQ82_1812 [Thermosediminibacterales bacterium]|nr:hypothetical protein [Thermosediminibacterales bacterium]MDK2836738.1 hypothetical protein [Thermosediminibacterales bacterium]